jgi:hypothetical protein
MAAHMGLSVGRNYGRPVGKRWVLRGSMGGGARHKLGIFPSGPWTRRPQDGLTRAGPHSEGGRPVQSFSQIPLIFQYSNTLQIVKNKKVTFVAQKISKLGMAQDKIERKKLPFWKKSKFPAKYELKFRKQI